MRGTRDRFHQLPTGPLRCSDFTVVECTSFSTIFTGQDGSTAAEACCVCGGGSRCQDSSWQRTVGTLSFTCSNFTATDCGTWSCFITHCALSTPFLFIPAVFAHRSVCGLYANSAPLLLNTQLNSNSLWAPSLTPQDRCAMKTCMLSERARAATRTSTST